MNSKTSSLEEIFLKIFKVVILIVMTLTLVVAAGAVLYAVYEYAQTPKEPAPAKKAPEKSVNIDDFLNSLKKNSPAEEKSDPEEPKAEQPAKPEPIKYKDEAKKIVGCFRESSKQASISGVNTGDDATEDFRKQLQRAADAKDGDRGQTYVDNAVKIACEIYLHPSVIQFRKSNKDQELFYSVLKFHIKAWDAIKEEARQFEKDEETRITNERNEEELRVSLARQSAKFSLLVALGAFGLFMTIALYLIFAAIESSVRKLSVSIEELKSHQVGQSPRLID